VSGTCRALYSHGHGGILPGWWPLADRRYVGVVLDSLLRRRLVFVTGKGGVGKSTVATALGMAAAGRGRRTMVAELAGQARVQRAFSRDAATFVEMELAPNLHTISIDPQPAMEEYLRLRLGPVARVLNASRVFNAFAMATPGMLELLSVGKAWELAQLERQTPGAAPYDFVVVDAPASGHGVGILRTPETFAEIAKVGPIARQGRKIATTIHDRRFTAVVAVCTPEEMAVAETIALAAALADQGLDLHAVILNALYPERFADAELDVLCAALTRSPSSGARSALAAAQSERARAATQRQLTIRLRDELTAPIVELPYLFAERIGMQQLTRLAGELDRALSR
jgi:anion-transporting  ArsA/GET3 family ATPase